MRKLQVYSALLAGVTTLLGCSSGAENADPRAVADYYSSEPACSEIAGAAFCNIDAQPQQASFSRPVRIVQHTRHVRVHRTRPPPKLNPRIVRILLRECFAVQRTDGCRKAVHVYLGSPVRSHTDVAAGH
jgi:hypothetical protein